MEEEDFIKGDTFNLLMKERKSRSCGYEYCHTPLSSASHQPVKTTSVISAPPPDCVKIYFCVLNIGIKASSDNEQEPSEVLKHDKTRSTLCFQFY